MGVRVIVAYDIFPQIAAQLHTNVVALAKDWMTGDYLPACQAGAPVDTGALRDSGHVEDRGDSVATVFTGGAGGRSYAAYQEFGTSRNAAHPFMLPAIDATFPSGVYARAGMLIPGS